MKSLPSTLSPSSKGRLAAGLDALDVVLREREEASGLACDAGAEVGEELLVAAGLGDLVVAIADPQQRETVGDGPVGERDGPRPAPQRGDVAVDDVVDEPALDGFGGADVTARRHHLERLGHPDETREALGATGAGEQPRSTSGSPNFADASATR